LVLKYHFVAESKLKLVLLLKYALKIRAIELELIKFARLLHYKLFTIIQIKLYI